MAKFFTKQRINLEATTWTLKSMWRSGGSFEVQDLGNNMAVISFEDEYDPKRIIMQGPWSFDKYLIGLFHLGELATVDDAKFDTASFWVQIHGLQIKRITWENAEAIAGTLGEVECVEELDKGDCCGRCM